MRLNMCTCRPYRIKEALRSSLTLAINDVAGKAAPFETWKSANSKRLWFHLWIHESFFISYYFLPSKLLLLFPFGSIGSVLVHTSKARISEILYKILYGFKSWSEQYSVLSKIYFKIKLKCANSTKTSWTLLGYRIHQKLRDPHVDSVLRRLRS